MIEKIIQNTEKYQEEHKKAERKSKGQFFTSGYLAKKMAGFIHCEKDHLRILEPGAGNGLLAAAIVQYATENNLCRCFSICYVEKDPDVIPLLRETVRILEAYAKGHEILIRSEIREEDFLRCSFSERYDAIICNPPYRKAKKEEVMEFLPDDAKGQPNLYGLFLVKSTMLLEEQGQLIFLTPRSWTSGTYYQFVRSRVIQDLNLKYLLVLQSRINPFGSETVQQEIMITVAEKSERQDEYITILDDAGGQIRAEAKMILGDTILIPSNPGELEVLKKMRNYPETFDSMGYRFRTGPVVEFRNQNDLRKDPGADTVPLIRMEHITKEGLRYPLPISKPQYLRREASSLLIPIQKTVLVRRFSSKEESKRLQSCIYEGSCPFISIENHVNYLTRKDGKPLSKKEILWAQGILESEDYESYMRMYSGNTQIGANDLNRLPIAFEVCREVW